MARFFGRKSPDAAGQPEEKERPAKKSHLGILSADTDEVPGQHRFHMSSDLMLISVHRVRHSSVQRYQTQRAPRSAAPARSHIRIIPSITVWPAAPRYLRHIAQLFQVTA